MSVLSSVRELMTRPDQEVAVVIPVYRESLDRVEEAALRQCVEILKSHPIIIVAPEHLALEAVLRVSRDFIVVRFPNEYFSDVMAYNRLMLSPIFYRRFLPYRYVLIHQLDAFVFFDRLHEWCAAGYDYIGAPWMAASFARAEFLRRELPFWLRPRLLGTLFGLKKRRVGNGGFSLRRVRACLLVLLIFRRRVSQWRFNEDMWWSIIVPSYLPWFRIPRLATALRFAFETKPRQCFEIVGGLPFGCHGWQEYDIAFWREHIPLDDAATHRQNLGTLRLT